MKKGILYIGALLFAAFTMLSFGNLSPKPVPSANSTLVWTGTKVGGEHMGTVNFKSVDIQFNGTQLSRANFVVDMTSISTTDLSGEAAQKKGKTRIIKFPVKTETKNHHHYASARIKLDRTKYGVNYGSKSIFKSIGDKFIYDDFSLDIKTVSH